MSAKIRVCRHACKSSINAVVSFSQASFKLTRDQRQEALAKKKSEKVLVGRHTAGRYKQVLSQGRYHEHEHKHGRALLAAQELCNATCFACLLASV